MYKNIADSRQMICANEAKQIKIWLLWPSRHLCIHKWCNKYICVFIIVGSKKKVFLGENKRTLIERIHIGGCYSLIYGFYLTKRKKTVGCTRVECVNKDIKNPTYHINTMKGTVFFLCSCLRWSSPWMVRANKSKIDKSALFL